MKKTVIAAALVIAAAGGAPVLAQGDFGIESAAKKTVVTDLANPQQGMVMNGYDIGRDALENSGNRMSKNVLGKLGSTFSALKTSVDKGADFNFECVKGTAVNTISWDGFIKCKRAGVYTFVFSAPSARYSIPAVYTASINCKTIDGYGQMATDFSLKAGWNQVKFVLHSRGEYGLSVSYKPKGSLSKPRHLGPRDLFYDAIPEEDW